MWELVKKYPVRVQAVVQAGLGMAMAYGLNISPEQMGATLMFSAAILALVTEKAVTSNSLPPKA